MKDLINMVLDVRKMEVGETKLKLQAYPFNSWIKEIGADFTDEGAAQEVQIDYQLDDSIKEVVFDKGMCTIVVTNLLTNALKHSPKNTTVTIRTSKNDSYVRVSVWIREKVCKRKTWRKYSSVSIKASRKLAVAESDFHTPRCWWNCIKVKSEP